VERETTGATVNPGGRHAGLFDLRELSGAWWLFAVRGVLALIFGALALVHPLAVLAAMVLLFGAWAFVDGVSALVLAFGGMRSWQLVLSGLIGVAAGVITFFRPGITALGLFITVSAWAIARGVVEIVLAIKLRKQIQGETWLILGGISSIAFGVLLFLMPVAGVLALGWLVGFYALLFGVLMIGLAMRLRRVAEKREVPPMATPTPVMP
jgi:uncharacterized membrane protein HdeD (DUF308 family)